MKQEKTGSGCASRNDLGTVCNVNHNQVRYAGEKGAFTRFWECSKSQNAKKQTQSSKFDLGNREALFVKRAMERGNTGGGSGL